MLNGKVSEGVCEYCTSDYKLSRFRPQYSSDVGLEYKAFRATLSGERRIEYQAADFNVSSFTSGLRRTSFLLCNVPRSRVSGLRLVKNLYFELYQSRILIAL